MKMKKLLRLSFLLPLLMLTFISVGYSVIHVTNPSEIQKNKSDLLKDQLSVNDILTKDRKEIESVLGKKLQFKDKVALKLIKRNLKKSLKKGKSKEELKRELANDKSEFNVGAFILGLLLGLIGVLLAYLFMEKEKAKSSWKGFGVLLILILIGALL
ncbi:MAG: hypothetical protein ACI9XB_004755 [Gammaproteobacteria bacterium]|jgi:hypothetical protein